MDLKEKLKKPACSKWNELAKIKPEIFQFVLVNTQYCRYPAQTACWNGAEFISTDNGKYLNITHWAEINDLGHKIPTSNEKTEFENVETYSKKQVEQINMYGLHQNYLGTQDKDEVYFQDWINDKLLLK